MSKLLLIDGMSTAYRAFYAIRGLTTSYGQPSNAVFGFIRMLGKVLKEVEPEYIAIAADSKGPTFRHEQFEDYKAHRKPMPQDLASQIPLIKAAAAGYRIPWLAIPGYEADDILATLAAKAAGEGFEVVILSGDKDLFQLVGDKVKVISPHKEGILFDRKAVEERYGVEPSRLGDVLALMGDSTDNVPGVPGVGEKTAVSLIKEYRNLDGVLEHAGEVKSKRVRENLVEYADQARLCRELVKLDLEVPVEWKWEDLKLEEPDEEKLKELFGKLEFKALLKEVSSATEKEIISVRLKGDQAARELTKRLRSAKELFFDLESGGGRPEGVSAIAIFPGRESEEVVYVALDDPKIREEVCAALKPFLEDKELKKYVHDMKKMTNLFLNEGIELKGVAWDSLLVSYLLNPSRPDHSLETVSMNYLGWSPAAGNKEEGGEGESLARRVEAIRGLEADLRDDLKEKKLTALLDEMELPLAGVLVRMERTGITLDKAKLKKMSDKLGKDLDELSRKMIELAGEEFNLNSPKQLSKILFGKLGLTPLKKTKTGYSTDVNVLKKLACDHELPALILEYRQLFKLKSTYIDTLPELVDPETGRLHTTFHQAVTTTGRLSSSSPNLQNIPIRTVLGREIRSAFIPAPADWLFLAVDYSQIDLRILAHLSEDPLLLEAFAKDEDIHTFTASQIFGVDLAEVTPEMRQRAKTVNFGIVYGMGSYGLAQDLGISYPEAEEFIKAYFERYTGVAEYTEKTIREAKERGYVTTLFNRRRYLPELESPQENVRRFGERTAINTPVQGSAADVLKLAMIEADRRLRGENFKARMLLQIHDELLFEAPEAELEPLAEMVRSAMEGVAELKVELKTDVKVGRNWGQMEKRETGK